METQKVVKASLLRDGSLAWFVCLAAFLANAVIIRIDTSFGEIIGPIMHTYNVTEGDAAWIGSVHSSAQYLGAFAASPLTNRFGFGPITFVGACAASIAFGAALICSNIPSLTASYGLFAGFAFGLAYTPANIVCTFYFNKKLPLALSLANSGNGFGTVVMAYIFNTTNDIYGFKGTTLLCMFISPLIGLLALLVKLIPIPNNTKDLNGNNLQPTQLQGKKSGVRFTEKYYTYKSCISQ